MMPVVFTLWGYVKIKSVNAYKMPGMYSHYDHCVENNAKHRLDKYLSSKMD